MLTSLSLNAFDFIKNSVLDQFNGSGTTVGQMILSLVVAFGMGLFILLIYRQTFRGVLYSKGFAFSLILLAMVTALVIRTISSNLALSLGMVGALSIVRFRTAIKEPMDIAFLFWAIAAGIVLAAGLIPLAVLVLFFCLINQLVRGSSLTVLLCVVLYIGLLVMGTYLPAVGGLVFTGYLRWHNLWIGIALPFFSLLPRIGLLAGYGLVFGCCGYLLFDRKEA